MTTIAALNVRLGMDASNFSQGVNLARNEVAKVTQIMNSAIPPHIKMRRELDLLEKAFSAAGQKTATYAAAVQAVKDKYEPFTKKTKEAAEAAKKLDEAQRAAVQHMVEDMRMIQRATANAQAVIRAGETSRDKLIRQTNELSTAYRNGQISADMYNRGLASLNQQLKATEQTSSGLLVYLRQLAAVYLGFQTAKSIIRTAADVQAASVQFEVLTGSAEKANKLLNDMKQFADMSPLSRTQVFQSGQTLLTFGMNADEVVGRLRQLGEVTGGNAEKFKLLTMAYAQASATGRLLGQDAIQMAQHGFAPLKIMADKTGKSQEYFKKMMEDGLFTIDMVNEALQTVTGAGGRFNGMTERMGKTFDGAYQQMVGSAHELSAAIGKDLLPVIIDAFNAIQKMASAAAKTWESMTALDKTVLASVASFIAVVSVAGMVSRAIIGVVAAMKALNIAQAITLSLQGPRGWAILAGAAVAAGVAIYAVNRAMAKTEEVVAKNGETAKATAGAFAGLAASVNSAIAASVKASAIEATSLRKLLDANIAFGEAAAELMQERAKLMFGEEEYANIEARMKGMTDEQVKQLANMQKEIEALQAKKDLQEGFAKAQEEALAAAQQYFAEERRADEERRKREIAGPMSVEVGSAEAARMAAEAWNARMAAPLKGEPTQKQFINKAKELLVSQAEANKKQGELLTAVKKATETMLETRPKLFR